MEDMFKIFILCYCNKVIKYVTFKIKKKKMTVTELLLPENES